MSLLVLLKDRPVLGKSDLQQIVESKNSQGGMRVIHAVVKGQGAVGATIRIYGCNDARFPVEVMTFTLSGNGVVTDQAKDNMPFEFYMAEVVAISGAGATVSVNVSI